MIPLMLGLNSTVEPKSLQILQPRERCRLIATFDSRSPILGRATGKCAPKDGEQRRDEQSEGDETAKKAAEDWTRDLEQFRSQLGNVDGLTGVKARLQSGWPGSFAKHLAALTATVEAKPDQTATVDAHTFLELQVPPPQLS